METHPSRVSMGDLFFGQERLRGHLASRREYLDSLNQRASHLDDQMLALLGQVKQARQEVANARSIEAGSAADRARLESEFAARQADGERLRARLEAKQQEIGRLKGQAAQAQQNKAADDARCAQLEAEIQRTQADVHAYERSLNQSLRLKQEQLQRR